MSEAGVKSDLLQGNLVATLSFFKIERTGGTFTTAFGPANDNPATAGLLETVVSPADESKGVELEVMAVISRKLTIYGSYQRTQTSRLLNNVFVEFRGIPRWTASVFAKYDLRGGARNGFFLRGGIIQQGDQQGDNANTFRIASETRFDAGVDYLYGDYSFALNVNNITDAIVPTQFAAFRSNSVLPPRQIRFTVSRSW